MKHKKVTIEDLAGIVKKGFDEASVNLGAAKKELKQDIGEVKQKVESLEQGQEDIKLRISQAAWGFEVREIEKRVNKLERKVGIK